MDTLKSVGSVLGRLPPLKKRKNPSLACVIGFLTGGIGLGLYFWSIVDVLIPVAIALLLLKVVGPAGILGGALVAALYGYARAATSNDRLAARDAVSTAGVDPAKAPSARRRRSVGLCDLVEAHVLTPESRLFAERGSNRYEATVKSDGTLEVPGLGNAASPSAAAGLARGRRTNGWIFWKVQTNKGVVPLSALRDELFRMRGSAAPGG
jgi:hypothetical protein